MELLKNIKYFESEIEGEVYFSLFDKYIAFVALDFLDIGYLEKCAEYLNSLNDNVIEDLCKASISYCNHVLAMYYDEVPKEFERPPDVLELIYPSALIIPYPENPNEPVIHLELNCAWEKEHGMEWIVRNDRVLYVSSYSGENPWRDFSTNEDGNFA